MGIEIHRTFFVTAIKQDEIPGFEPDLTQEELVERSAPASVTFYLSEYAELTDISSILYAFSSCATRASNITSEKQASMPT